MHIAKTAQPKLNYEMTPEEFNDVELFYNRIVTDVQKVYDFKAEDIIRAIKNALAHDWSICTNKAGMTLGFQSNIYRDKIFVGNL